jgi:hypothetical protein
VHDICRHCKESFSSQSNLKNVRPFPVRDELLLNILASENAHGEDCRVSWLRQNVHLKLSHGIAP